MEKGGRGKRRKGEEKEAGEREGGGGL